MKYKVSEGNYEKFGLQVEPEGVTFTFEGEKEDHCAILLYSDDGQVRERIDVPKTYCLGAIRSVFVQGLSVKKLQYNYEINGEVVTDAYAKRIIGRELWNDRSRQETDFMIYGGYEPGDFDWQGDVHPEVPKSQMMMYKLNVREFSMDGGAKGKEKGTFRAIMNKIPYFKKLGITTLELMPVYEFEEMVLPEKIVIPEYLRWNMKTDDLIKPQMPPVSEKVNCWGYVPGYYFAVKASYCYGKETAREFKELVRQLHANGMECVMEIFANQEMNQNLILDALRFWVQEFHMDGFHLLGDSFPVTAIAQDLLLCRTKIFYTGFEEYLLDKRKNYPHLFLYNEEYLYQVRKIMNHMGGSLEEFANQQKKQRASLGFVNYLTNNNGFTMMDLFSYSEKHNEANGEDNRDGNNWNCSNNSGIEGPTTKKFVTELRNQQMRNAFAVMLLAQGVPLLLSGDEFANSKDGNNNAYCQDNPIGWLNWKKAKRYEWLTEFVGHLSAFRREHPILSMERPMEMNDYARKGYPDLSYHGENAWISGFTPDRQAYGAMYCGAYVQKKDQTADDFIYVGYNFHNSLSSLALPKLPNRKQWYLVMDTSLGKQAFLPEPQLRENQQILDQQGQSVTILIGK